MFATEPFVAYDIIVVRAEVIMPASLHMYRAEARFDIPTTDHLGAVPDIKGRGHRGQAFTTLGCLVMHPGGCQLCAI
jgi:hypothetical protein